MGRRDGGEIVNRKKERGRPKKGQVGILASIVDLALGNESTHTYTHSDNTKKRRYTNA